MQRPVSTSALTINRTDSGHTAAFTASFFSYEEADTAIVLSHPDYTVGSGITPDLLTLPKQALAGLQQKILPLTAGRELHPALRTSHPPEKRL
ncbi:hypothetical protein AA0313_2399 [Acetobacter indonesiensis NRIC 0313]|nr:hypothetical protein AA0313_2399 [Acetobacter indonesiensis NRIC 0313]